LAWRGENRIASEMSGPPVLSPTPRILLVESDVTLSAFLRHHLEIEGYRVEATEPSPDLPEGSRDHPPDLILLDWTKADDCAFDLCRRFRKQRETTRAPIIALTSTAPGAESARRLITRTRDHFVKPFSFPAFIARVNALLKRAKAEASAAVRIGNIELDANGHRVRRNGQEIELGPAEFRLLEFLMRNAGKVLSREQMVVGAWGRGEAVDIRAIDVNVRRVRRAINVEGLADPIRTVRRLGYSFDPGPGRDRTTPLD
jgi:two-component system phosphate regulon response regulator PhoB